MKSQFISICASAVFTCTHPGAHTHARTRIPRLLIQEKADICFTVSIYSSRLYRAITITLYIIRAGVYHYNLIYTTDTVTNPSPVTAALSNGDCCDGSESMSNGMGEVVAQNLVITKRFTGATTSSSTIKQQQQQ